MEDIIEFFTEQLEIDYHGIDRSDNISQQKDFFTASNDSKIARTKSEFEIEEMKMDLQQSINSPFINSGSL